uniref:Uncharacterized protein n=1 Tax=Schistosoma curassoni TaxID=6186 RepID=A0A183K5D0_9TREM
MTNTRRAGIKSNIFGRTRLLSNFGMNLVFFFVHILSVTLTRTGLSIQSYISGWALSRSSSTASDKLYFFGSNSDIKYRKLEFDLSKYLIEPFPAPTSSYLFSSIVHEQHLVYSSTFHLQLL